jgi:hypothetical protein
VLEMTRTTGALQAECPNCDGMGYTEATCTEMNMRWCEELGAYVEQSTARQGSGCFNCLGLGQLGANL